MYAVQVVSHEPSAFSRAEYDQEDSLTTFVTPVVFPEHPGSERTIAVAMAATPSLRTTPSS
jgi:hypothetical protein